MNRIIIIFLMSLSCFIGMSIFGPVVLATYEIKLDNVNVMPIDKRIQNRHSLTNKPVELYGPVDEKVFFYEVKTEAKKDENKVVFFLKHSELLIEPSAVTFSIDDETVQSVSLKKSELTNKVVIPLTKEALSKGFHTVTVSFNGVLKEGICVNQETRSNWLTIGTDSYIQLHSQKTEDVSLLDFPIIFSAKQGQSVSVIIPDKPSLETRSAGSAIAAFLQSKSEDAKSVKVVRESNVNVIAGNFIVVGSQSEFQTAWVKTLITEANVSFPDKGLLLSRHRLNEHAESLFILVKSAEQFKGRVDILLDESFRNQLTGQQMVITSTPKIDKTNGLISLKKFGMSNLTFDRANRETDTYFGYAPPSWNAKPTLELLLRRSDTLKPRNSKEDKELAGEDVELVVHINNVPYSVDIRELSEEENDVFTVQIPIEEGTIQENHLISLRIEVNGLRRKNPCYSTNENRWVYLSEESYFTFHEGDSTSEKTLNSFPYPFSDPSQPTKVILPTEKEVTDGDLTTLISSLTGFGQVPIIELFEGNYFNESDAENSHLIFLGGVDSQPILKSNEEDLIVPYKANLPDFHSFGFLQEAVQQYSWIQENPWSKKGHAMLVFDTAGPEAKVINERFLESLTNLNEASTVAIQTKENHIYTNSNDFKIDAGSVKVASISDSKSSFMNSSWWMVGFGILILAVLVLLIVVKRKRLKGKENM
ncbi:cellulose biosynthesis cyclic di-GMP-binding regulatory protein BcsB [Sporosarcina siberiensis]|uniref:Cellulose biosynthesis cyclic di-GMP-binding regulatory protein BcsB n=1 Tax=Sporosarcina siberiensis TaxID=1365606 RepID=A0ABW4SHR0_9BACL